MAKKDKDRGKGLWVINKDKNSVLIPMDDRAGRPVALTLHQTWIPQDMTMQGSRKDIINAPNFKRAEMLSLIQVISDAEAEKILATKDAQIEQSRIYSLAENIRLNGDINVDVSVIDSNNEDTVVAHAVLTEETHSQQNNKFRSMVNSGKMNVQSARLIRKEIKQEEDKSKRNRTLWNLAKEYIEEHT